jgi:hypothetical protein
MKTVVDDFIEEAERRARQWYETCRVRSQARREAGVSLEMMYAAYDKLIAAGGEVDDPFNYSEADKLADAINEELFARGTVEDCIEQEMARYLSLAALQLIFMPVPLN